MEIKRAIVVFGSIVIAIVLVAITIAVTTAKGEF